MLTEDANLLRWTLSSLALFLALGSLAFLAKKVGPVNLHAGKGERRMKLKEILHLDARNKVCLIEVDGTEKMIAVNHDGISELTLEKCDKKS